MIIDLRLARRSHTAWQFDIRSFWQFNIGSFGCVRVTVQKCEEADHSESNRRRTEQGA